MVIAAGMDWNSPYSCKDWVKKFMLTFPVIDDTKGRSIYNHIGDGIVPFNIVSREKKNVERVSCKSAALFLVQNS